MMTAQQHTILITGAGARVGRALAIGLAQDGHAIAVHYNRSDTGARETVALIEENGGKAVLVQADLADEAQVETLVPRATEALGPVTALINNASVFERDDALTATRDSWDMHLNVNLRAPLVLTQALARQRPEDHEAVVINLIDQRVWALTPDFTSYTISKAGLWTLTKTLAQGLAPHIRVNAIAPGPTLKSSRQSEEIFQQQVEAVPLQRGPTLDEFVGAAKFILETPSYTGQMIALDGGQHLAWETPDVVGVDA